MAITHLVDKQDRFSELLERHQGIIGTVTRTYCWHPDDRDELSQEILTQLWRAFPSYDDAHAFSTWMYRVALNVSISWLRRNSLRQRHMTELGDDVDQVAATNGDSVDDERSAFLHSFIDNLDPLNRALMLLYLEDRSYQEISAILGITQTNVATKISRLKQRVRQHSARIHSKGEDNGTR
ncbi:MAG: RNA polymerase sigma factor [Gammaproteobacteria bacterium]